ncbi:Gfo/Idh/MocA family protein [Hwangdonia lutea]|uniref:Gfo/Idh/MocA family oxidoreductase n=1 Tax=Hwangdonia lutea TaxID=3075823 RepID=A0AA97ELA8_9FLAO|nr:Gfo/Idh/MocA family oxidoreductase [Hwangdonia sp. SCSIO 19198]WOD43584.1 Gfo/Idh/MocA family oxidoreductase [Hwangdonia sp. SCSIO 19198]
MKPKKSQVTRRNFVKGTSLAAGGILLTPSLLTASPVFNKTKKLKLAVVGCGGRGTGAVSQALRADENVELVAMADAFSDRLEKAHSNLSKMFQTGKLKVKPSHKFVGFGSYKKAIDAADVVILTTPPGFRPQHFEYAVSQGKHVFMEKPLATDVAGIKKVLEAAKVAKAKKLNVVVGLQRHYQANYMETYNRIQKGDIGQIVSGQVYWNGAGVWVNPREASQTEMEYQMRNWYYFNWICGDHILEQHIHNIDVANWFIGGHPIKASGTGGREVRKGKDHGHIFDHHVVEFEYENGIIISSQCRHQPGTKTRVDESFQGTLGTAYTDGGGSARLKKYDGTSIYTHDNENDINPYQQEHNLLFKSIRNGEVISDAENGAISTMTAILGRMATYSGKEITWDEAMALEHKLVPDEDTLTFDSVPPITPDVNGNYPIPVPGKTKFI